MPEKDIQELAQKFAEKNASLLRLLMENHFVRTESLEFSQGKCIKGKVKDIDLTHK